ncbi:MAG: hypothetical protein JXQ73_16145 [Phycisphaerae bacterium]|nr:hypothetical protein [Phycisphaerae bacterium]
MSTSAARHVVWLILAPVLAVGAVAAAGALPTKSLAGREGLVAMGVGCGLSVLATILGSAPAAWAAIKNPEKLLVMALGATILRVIILVLLAVPVAAFAGLPSRAFLLWVGIAYLAALAGEIPMLVLLVRRTEAHK